jgi:hypothetical protein
MIFGMPVLTFLHVVISLIGIATGLVVLFGFSREIGWTG